ncbi:importin beta-2 [Pelomyxa schiedti]|nr:importin beta-2 [Pelomyxa schiedti]
MSGSAGAVWSPSIDVLRQVIQFMTDTLDTSKQEAVRVQHEVLRKQPQVIRELAALLLKSSANNTPSTAPVIESMKTAVLPLIADASPAIRHAVANVITVLLGRLPRFFLDWPELLPAVTTLICDANANYVEGGLYLLHILCEDYTSLFDDIVMGRPLLTILPLLVKSFQSSHEPWRYYALMCIYEFIATMPGAIQERIDSLIQSLVMLSADQSFRVKLFLCKIFGSLAEGRPDFLVPHMRSVVPFILSCTDHADHEIALAGCEFWILIFTSDSCVESLSPFLNQLLQLLPTKMVITNSDETDFDFSDYDSTNNSDWNIRKSAVVALESVSEIFQDQCLTVLFPVVSELLKSDKWQYVECGILALGAISDGCKKGMLPHIVQMATFLTAQLAHPQLHVRATTCWTLSRYAVNLLPMGEQIVQPILAGIITRINTDISRAVKSAACRAIGSMAEKIMDQDLQMPYLNDVLSGMMLAFGSYKVGESLDLYDAISAVIDCACDTIAVSPTLQGMLLGPLGTKWNSLTDDNAELVPLMECFTSIIVAMGAAFSPYAQSLTARCASLITSSLASGVCSEPLEMAIDLVSSVIQSVPDNAAPLVKQFNIVPLMCGCLAKRDMHSPSLLQSCFTLLGNLIIFCLDDVAHSIHLAMPVLLESINPNIVSMCANACWALSEVVLHYHENVQVWGPTLVGKLISIQSDRESNENLLLNTAILLCRLSFVAPTTSGAANLMTPDSLKNVCLSIRKKLNNQKDSVLIGLCLLVQHNPGCGVPVLPFFCDAILSNRPSPQLTQKLIETLTQLHTQMGAHNWATLFAGFPPALKKALTSLGLRT